MYVGLETVELEPNDWRSKIQKSPSMSNGPNISTSTFHPLTKLSTFNWHMKWKCNKSLPLSDGDPLSKPFKNTLNCTYLDIY